MKLTYVCVRYLYNEDRQTDFCEVGTEIEERPNVLNITIEYDILYNHLEEHTFAKIIRKFVGTLSEWKCMKCYTLYIFHDRILSSCVYLSLRSCPFTSGFPTTIQCAFLLFPIRCTCPVYLIRLDLITLITSGEEKNCVAPHKCTFIPYLTAFSVWPLNIFPTDLISKTHNLFFFYCDGPHFTCIPTRGKIIVLYILIFRLLDWKGRKKKSDGMVASIPWI